MVVKTISPEKTGNMQIGLENVKARKGVVGYILRSSDSASIDITDPNKVIDYAVLSAKVLESGNYLSKAFKLGEVRTVLMEGNDVKILSFTVGDNRVSVFMDKSVDHDEVYKDLIT